MHRYLTTVLWISLVACLGCTSTVVDQTPTPLGLGEVRTAAIGDPFLVAQKGTVSTVRRWVGVLYSEDGWEISKKYSHDFNRRELLYAGRSGSTIDVTYREFRGSLDAPAFSQSLKYDLAGSNVVRFQNFTIEVIEATNDGITARVVADR